MKLDLIIPGDEYVVSVKPGHVEGEPPMPVHQMLARCRGLYLQRYGSQAGSYVVGYWNGAMGTRIGVVATVISKTPKAVVVEADYTEWDDVVNAFEAGTLRAVVHPASVKHRWNEGLLGRLNAEAAAQERAAYAKDVVAQARVQDERPEEHTQSGDDFDAMLEEIVALANGLQMRRRSFEKLPPEERGKILGALVPWRNQLREHVGKIDTALSAILDDEFGETD